MGLSAGKPGLSQENWDKLAALPVSGGSPPKPAALLPLGTEGTSAELPLTEDAPTWETAAQHTAFERCSRLHLSLRHPTQTRRRAPGPCPHESQGGPQRGRGGERSAPGLSEAGSPPWGSPHGVPTRSPRPALAAASGVPPGPPCVCYGREHTSASNTPPSTGTKVKAGVSLRGLAQAPAQPVSTSSPKAPST